jgi:hypothetical protein
LISEAVECNRAEVGRVAWAASSVQNCGRADPPLLRPANGLAAYGRTLADPGGLGRRDHVPALLLDAPDEQAAGVRAGPGVAWSFIRVLLVLSGFNTPSLKEARINNVARNYS